MHQTLQELLPNQLLQRLFYCAQPRASWAAPGPCRLLLFPSRRSPVASPNALSAYKQKPKHQRKISIDSLLKLSITVHINSQGEETVLKAHGLGQLCSTARPSQPPSPCSGRRWPAACFHRKLRDEAAKSSCKSAQSWKGKLCTTEVTKTLVIITKDQETRSTAQPALTGR